MLTKTVGVQKGRLRRAMRVKRERLHRVRGTTCGEICGKWFSYHYGFSCRCFYRYDYWNCFLSVSFLLLIATLALALLSASVDSTYLGLRLKYVHGGPIFFAFEPSYVIMESYSPNGSLVDSYSLCPEVGGGCERYPGKLGRSLNVHLLQATKLAPTIFPIIFTAVLASTIRLVARWKAETKSSLDVREFLSTKCALS